MVEVAARDERIDRGGAIPCSARRAFPVSDIHSVVHGGDKTVLTLTFENRVESAVRMSDVIVAIAGHPL